MFTDFKLQTRFCNFTQNANVSSNKCIKVCINLVAQGSKSNISRTWNFICSVYNFNRFNIDGKLPLEKPNTDEHIICIKFGLMRDNIGNSMHEKNKTIM